MFTVFDAVDRRARRLPSVPRPCYFGGAGLEHQEKYGTKTETFAKISVKARKHARTTSGPSSATW